MEWTAIVFVIVFTVLGVIVWALLDPDEQRSKYFNKLLASRAPVSDKELYDRFFGDDMPCDIPASVRRILAHYMDYPADKILPDDDLMFYWRELDLVDVFRDLEDEFSIRISQADLTVSACTVRSFSDLVQRLNKTKSKNSN